MKYVATMDAALLSRSRTVVRARAVRAGPEDRFFTRSNQSADDVQSDQGTWITPGSVQFVPARQALRQSSTNSLLLLDASRARRCQAADSRVILLEQVAFPIISPARQGTLPARNGVFSFRDSKLAPRKRRFPHGETSLPLCA